MPNKLSQMTLEELWKLFPIVLSAHQSEWADWYLEEQNRIAGLLTIEGVRISHIGSTAIPTIWAKPIVDILLELPPTVSLDAVASILTGNGYLCMAESAARKSFNKGYTDKGFAERVFHLHLRMKGDNDELYFRDYLNSHPAVAKAYEQLKRRLWKQYPQNRDAYTQAKTAFVRTYTECAKQQFKGRYASVE